MSRIGWWLGKELREARTHLLILLGCGLLFTWVYVWTGRGSPPDPESARGTGTSLEAVHTWTREQGWSKAFSCALWGTAGLAGAIFTSERRRGVAPLVARTPGAWAAAFWGKLLFWALLVGTAALLQGLWLGRLAVLYNLQDRGAPVDVLWLGPRGELRYTSVAMGLFFGATMLLGAIAGPARLAGAGGVLLAAAVYTPFVLLGNGVDRFYEWWLGSERPLLFLGAAAALVVSGVAWFRWVRAARSQWRAPVLASACMLVVASGAFAVAAIKRGEYDDVHPDDEDAHLTVAAIGPDSRYAFVTARRITEVFAAWSRSRPEWVSAGQMFAIDLRTGRSHALGHGAFFPSLPNHLYPWLVDAPRLQLGMREAGQWGYASRNVSARTLDPADDEGVEKEVEDIVRDRQAVLSEGGVRSWISTTGSWQAQGPDGELRTTKLELVQPTREVTAIRAIPGGWTLRWGGQSGGARPWLAPGIVWASVQAEDGKVRHVGIEAVQPRSYQALGWLSPDRLLLVPNAPYSDPRRWHVLSLDTTSSEPTSAAWDPATPSAVRPLAVLGPTSVLGVDTESRPVHLVVLDVKAGRSRRLDVEGIGQRGLYWAWALETHPVPSAVGGIVLVSASLGEEGFHPDEDGPVQITPPSGAWSGPAP